MNPKIEKALKKTGNSFRQMMPVMLGVIFLTALAVTAIPQEVYSQVFTGNQLLDSLAGALIGSVAAGNPVNSYIIGGELLNGGISLAAVAAFIMAWVTVGVVQFPAESMMLGRRFALARNIAGFGTSVVAGMLLAAVLEVFA